MSLSHVFVSSTCLDLEPYRAAVTRAVITAGDMPVDMIYWPASEERPIDACLSRVRSSDLVILLVAHRYGHAPAGSESITELEFQEAHSRGIPVLAFLLDQEFPWPPKWIDRDPHSASRLADFRKRVSELTTCHTFTSPESLETAVTHAVSSFRSRRAANSVHIPSHRRVTTALSCDVLRFSPDAFVRIGRAPDGAQLLLHVARTIDLETPLATIRSAVGARSNDFNEVCDTLNQRAKAHAVTRNIESCKTSTGHRECFVTRRTMAELFAPSLLESIIGGRLHDEGDFTTSHRPGRVAASDETPPSMAVGLMRSDGSEPRIQSSGGENRFLCLPLDGDTAPWSGGREDMRDVDSMHLWRTFEEEGVEQFRSVQYEIRITDSARHRNEFAYRGPEQVKYLDAWLQCLQDVDPTEARQIHSRLSVSRASLVRFLVHITHEIAKLHQNNVVHGDIKPSNILAARVGPKVIDAVGLTVGDISPLVTLGWSPPEQLVRQPLTRSADVFTLGLLFLRALGGQRLGKLSYYRLPDGNEAIQVDDPAVFISSEANTLSATGKATWARVLETALRSRPEARQQEAGDLAEDIAKALVTEEPRGELAFALPWKGLPIIATAAAGQREIAWVIKDVPRRWD